MMFDTQNHKCPKCERVGALQWNCKTKILSCIYQDCDYYEHISWLQIPLSDYQLKAFLEGRGEQFNVPFYGLPRIKIFNLNSLYNEWRQENKFNIYWLLEAHKDYFLALSVHSRGGMGIDEKDSTKYRYEIIRS